MQVLKLATKNIWICKNLEGELVNYRHVTHGAIKSGNHVTTHFFHVPQTEVNLETKKKFKPH